MHGWNTTVTWQAINSTRCFNKWRRVIWINHNSSESRHCSHCHSSDVINCLSFHSSLNLTWSDRITWQKNVKKRSNHPCVPVNQITCQFKGNCDTEVKVAIYTKCIGCPCNQRQDWLPYVICCAQPTSVDYNGRQSAIRRARMPSDRSLLLRADIMTEQKKLGVWRRLGTRLDTALSWPARLQ